MTTNYTIYCTDTDSFYYNTNNSLSFAEDIKHARMISTVADAFKICCELYEKYYFNLDELAIIEVMDKDNEIVADFKFPVWSSSDDLKLLWLEVEEELKDLLLRGLFQDGLQVMYKIVKEWRLRECDPGYDLAN